jgi:SNF2 family DNA or RNA helicase
MRSRKDLRLYQNKMVHNVLAAFDNREGGHGLWVDMGLGKTVSTLTALQDLFDDFAISHVLVIAPKFVAQHTWPAELKEWDHFNMTHAVAVGTPVARETAVRRRAQLTFINRENVEWLVKSINKANPWYWDVVVIDEASSFKSSDAKRFRALQFALKKKNPFVIELTGTPAGNGYMDIWSQVLLMDKGKRLHPTITAYRERYFHAIQMDFGCTYEIKAGAAQKIQDELRGLVTVMETEDYLQLPELVQTEVSVELNAASRRAYDEMAKTLYLEMADGEIMAQSGAALVTKLRQLATGAVYDFGQNVLDLHETKLEALDRIVEEANGKPMMVAYAFEHERDAILARYKNARTLKSAADIDLWNAGKTPMLVLHPASAGHGLNLQHGGNIIVWYSLPWSLELYQQMNKRLHRSGQKASQVLSYLLSVANTVDQKIVAALQKKAAAQKDLLSALK